MATSYIKYNDKGFWAPDELVSIWAAFIYMTLSDIRNKPDWIGEWTPELRTNSYGYFVGFTNLYLEEYITTEERKELLLNTLGIIRRSIMNEPEDIVLERFNNCVDDDGKNIWSGREVKRERISKMVDYTISLLKRENIPLEMKF